ncbi:unnamed protein product [Rangifer tarandus platyrhynchus]|uniref:Uncharacterized protein n=2 Tax=Rangifer tarandus platyrhynchus TaxID=3082113 RepID=A0ABN8YS58_RANTA|nr:unnamed protein product [Rangifer tarandus platyrhynchus]CAI9702048.1 unnamed protein product [Rangifer tarandus platyrhynchus]
MILAPEWSEDLQTKLLLDNSMTQPSVHVYLFPLEPASQPGPPSRSAQSPAELPCQRAASWQLSAAHTAVSASGLLSSLGPPCPCPHVCGLRLKADR